MFTMGFAGSPSSRPSLGHEALSDKDKSSLCNPPVDAVVRPPLMILAIK